MREDLLQLSTDEKEQLAIVKKATAGGWKSFYKLKKDTAKDKRKPEKKGPNNFQGREYDMDSLEKRLLGN